MFRVSPVYHIGSSLATTTDGQPAQEPHRVGPLVEQVLPADGLDGAPVPLADRHAHPVALDQAPALVGDGVGGLAGMEAGVDLTGEFLQLRPEDLAVGEVSELAALEKVARQIAHLLDEPQVSFLDGGPGLGALEDLQDPDHFQLGLQCPEDQQVVGRIGPLFAVLGPGVRRDHQALAGGHDFVQQPGVVDLLLFIGFGKPCLLEVDLVLQGQPSLVAHRPDDPTNSSQCRHHPGEQFGVELLRGQFALGELGDLLDQHPDLLLGLFDQVRVVGLLATHANPQKGLGIRGWG